MTQHQKSFNRSKRAVFANRVGAEATLIVRKGFQFWEKSDFFLEQGDYAGAERELAESVSLLESAGGGNEASLVLALHELGLLCHAQDKHSAGESYFLCALRKAERLYGLNHSLVNEIREALSNLCDERDTYFGLGDNDQ